MTNFSFVNKTFILWCLTIIVVTVIVYFQTLPAVFMLDDRHVIVGSHLVNIPYDIKTHFIEKPTRFIFYWTMSLNSVFAQQNPAYYRIINILLHACNAVLLLFLLNIMPQKRRSQIWAFLAVMVFVLHPLNTQVAVYVSQRLASMATLFYLLALTSYFAYREHRISAKAFFPVFTISALLGMFTKEICFTLPFAILLADFLFYRSTIKVKKEAYFYLVLSGLVLVLPAIMFFIGADTLQDVKSLNDASKPFWLSSYHYFLTQLTVLPRYFSLFLFPVGQSLEHDVVLNQSLFDSFAWLSLVTMIGLVFFALKIKDDRPEMAFGVLLYFLLHSVESSFMPIPDLMYEHRMYLPMIALVIILDSIWSQWELRWPHYMRWQVVGINLLLIGLTFATVCRNQIWMTGVRMWTDVTEKYPAISRAHQNLGFALIEEQSSYQEAQKHFFKAVELEPKNGKNYYNLAVVYEKNGLIDEAIESYLAAAIHSPVVYQPHMALAKIYFTIGKYDEALSQLDLVERKTTAEFKPQIDNYRSEINAKKNSSPTNP